MSTVAIPFAVERPPISLSRSLAVAGIFALLVVFTVAGITAGYSFGYLHGYDQGFELGSRGRLPEVTDSPDWSKWDMSKVKPLSTGPADPPPTDGQR